MDARELGRKVLSYRKEKKLSQEELARLVGVSRNYVSLIERGEAHGISMKVVSQLAIALGTSPGELTGEISAETMVMIPPALRQFGLEKKLSFEIIDKLARIPRRGREPRTVKEWADLYSAISPFIDEGQEK